MRRLELALAASVLFGWPARASADFIATATFETTVSGKLGGQSFTNALVRFIGTYDVADVVKSPVHVSNSPADGF
jgi:hypothetical protein